jgi:hypothetical protein
MCVYGGDDSFHDMISEVIGRGREFYKRVLADPTELDGMAVTENFHYNFPDDDD